MKSLALTRALPLALTLCAASLVGACSSLDGIFPKSGSPQQGAQQDKRETPDSEKPVRLPLTAAELQCPPIEIDEGGAAARVGGPDNASVRYQFDIGQTARECAPLSDNQFSLKVGVSGHLLIGPAGKAGAYSAPLRVTVHDENTKKDAFTKVYKVEASAPDNAAFSIVTEPIVLPMVRTELADDYTLTVGFDSGKAATSPSPRPKKSHPKPKKTEAPN